MLAGRAALFYCSGHALVARRGASREAIVGEGGLQEWIENMASITGWAGTGQTRVRRDRDE